MTPFSSPLFWCLVLSVVFGVVFGALLCVTWKAPVWLTE